MKYLLTILILTFFACKKEVVEQPKQQVIQVAAPDSIKYVVSDNIGCRISWHDENGLPHIEQVQNLKNFTKKVKAISGVEYLLECQNSPQSYSYIYLNDSLVDADQSSDFVHGCYSQWTYH